MGSGIQVNGAVMQELATRGVTEKTGVYGEHKVQIGQGSPINLESLKSAKVPYEGFRTATKVNRGKEGVQQNAQNAVKVLSSSTGPLDVKSLLESLKAAQTHADRLGKLGQLSEAQKGDSAWVFAAAVESLSNTELAAAFEKFTSAEMDLLQTALIHEGETNPKAEDARKAAKQLFTLQALVLKEVSNRAVSAKLDDLRAANPNDQELAGIEGPRRLSDQYGTAAPTSAPSPTPAQHDITAANLETLVNVAAKSASIREHSAEAEQMKLSARSLEGVTVKDMADIMRSADLTINVDPSVIIDDGTVFDDPDKPLKNIFHLQAEGKVPKGAGYLAKRESVEQLLFPELGGHDVNADERPLYGALNLRGSAQGAAARGYGAATLILKPEVAKRATYIADDTFLAPRMVVSDERRQIFLTLLDGKQELPQGLRDAIRDSDSPARKDLDAWLDELQAMGETSIAFIKENSWPESVGNLLQDANSDKAVTDSNWYFFQALLIQCFGDSKATRSITATHDNLEALIPSLGDVDGNNLARAALEAQKGRDPRVVLSGINYVEAQIQGQIIPSRDVAEIRIDLYSVPQEKLQRTIARAEDFQKRTGIKVTLFNRPEVIKGKPTVTNKFSLVDEYARFGDVSAAQEGFNTQHIDKGVLDSEKNEYLAHLKEHTDAYLAGHPNLAAGLHAGALHLEGRALDTLATQFVKGLERKLQQPSSVDAKALVTSSFEEAVRPLLELKATLLRDLEQLPFDTPAQKAAFAQWVCSAGKLSSPEEMRLFHKHAMAQAAVLTEIASSDPTPNAHAIYEAVTRLSVGASKDFTSYNQTLDSKVLDPDFIRTQPHRISFLSIAMLQNGEPPLGQADLHKLYELLTSPESMDLSSQMEAVMGHGDFRSAADYQVMKTACDQMAATIGNIARLTGDAEKYPVPIVGGLYVIPESARAILRAYAPGVAQMLDAQFPGFKAFPAPLNPESMPQQDADRRRFLISVLDGYLNHEKTFERGTSTHGRGHIARAYIFASVMCNILSEHGIPVDRTAVLCGIAGHDLARQGGGRDHWEGLSADRTVQEMLSVFGSGIMGATYLSEVSDCIDQHKSKTLESMLLNAADSLDIGRIGEGVFKLEEFPFLRGPDGNAVGREEKRLREKLANEADLLQKLTSPLCAGRSALDRLTMKRVEAMKRGNMALVEIYGQQRAELSDGIEAQLSSDWDISSEDFVTRIESVVRDNPDIFPTLSKYYH